MCWWQGQVYYQHLTLKISQLPGSVSSNGRWGLTLFRAPPPWYSASILTLCGCVLLTGVCLLSFPPPMMACCCCCPAGTLFEGADLTDTVWEDALIGVCAVGGGRQ